MAIPYGYKVVKGRAVIDEVEAEKCMKEIEEMLEFSAKKE